MMNKTENFLSPEEIKEIFIENNLQGYCSNTLYHTGLDSIIHDRIVVERNKLTNKGLFRNSGNMKAFLSALIKRVKRKNTSSCSWKDHFSISVERGSYTLNLEIYEDRIRVNFGSYSHAVYICLHSNYYEEVLDFLFTEGNEFDKFVTFYQHFRNSIAHYNTIAEEIHKEENYIKVLSDKDEYSKFKTIFDDTSRLLKPLEKYLNLYSWEDSIRLYGINPSVKEIAAVTRLASGKPLEKCAKYQKRYEKALTALTGAKELGLLSAEEDELLIPWSEFITKVSGETVASENANKYLSLIQDSFNTALNNCDLSGTAYMLKKKQRMEANIELCRQLRETHGLNCFIDNSQFSSRTGHFNVITKDNQVWIFRIARITPSIDDASHFVMIVKSLTQISEILDKPVKLTDAGKRHPRKLTVFTRRNGKSVSDEVLERLKELKNVRLIQSANKLYLSIPVGNQDWVIPINYKNADSILDSILPLIQQYLKLYNSREAFAVKGIFKERKPNL